MKALSVWVDESAREGDLIVVAGVLADWSVIPSIVGRWRSEVKAAVGLPRDAEIKWSLGEDHPTRQVLEEQGYTTRDLRERMVSFMEESNDVTCCVIAMLERRQRRWESWQQWWPKAGVRDFYCEALRFLVQRAAEEVVELEYDSCVVVCDTPELGGKVFQFQTIRRGPQAVAKTYQEWHRSGVGVGPGRAANRNPLEDIGFHSSILIGDATYHDMLQIADGVAGATRAGLVALRQGKTTTWEVQCLRNVARRFRNRHGNPAFFGDGLVVWPPDDDLRDLLQKTLWLSGGCEHPRGHP